jgi:EpsI family protein
MGTTMLESRPSPWVLLVPAFLVAQLIVVGALSGHEHPPPLPSPSGFPSTVGEWKVASTEPIDESSVRELRAERLVSQNYIRVDIGVTANLFVAWFQTQRGDKQPHSPKVCLPGSGWTPESSGDLLLLTSAGTITVNRYVVVRGPERLVALYWYQTPRRAIAGEWASKFWLVADGFRFRRTDTALVRVIVLSSPGRDEEAIASAADFARKLYPELRSYFPQ